MSHGGLRPNSGRKTPASPYKEKTSVVRVPNSVKPDVLVYLMKRGLKSPNYTGDWSELPLLNYKDA